MREFVESNREKSEWAALLVPASVDTYLQVDQALAGRGILWRGKDFLPPSSEFPDPGLGSPLLSDPVTSLWSKQQLIMSGSHVLSQWGPLSTFYSFSIHHLIVESAAFHPIIDDVYLLKKIHICDPQRSNWCSRINCIWLTHSNSSGLNSDIISDRPSLAAISKVAHCPIYCLSHEPVFFNCIYNVSLFSVLFVNCFPFSLHPTKNVSSVRAGTTYLLFMALSPTHSRH